MKYEDAKDNCQWCKKELWAVNGERPKAFCNDDCRTKYHNAKKKIKAQKDKLLEFVSFLHEMMGKNGELANEAAQVNNAIYELSRQRTGIKISCRQCGQMRFSMPRAGDKCSFCGDSNWKYGSEKELADE